MDAREERKEQFIKDLKELCRKHKAYIGLEEINRRPWMGGDWVISVTLDSEYDKNLECTREMTDFNLGNCFDGKE